MARSTVFGKWEENWLTVIPENYGFRVVQVTMGMNSVAMAVPHVNYAVRNFRQIYNLLSLAQFSSVIMITCIRRHGDLYHIGKTFRCNAKVCPAKISADGII